MFGLSLTRTLRGTEARLAQSTENHADLLTRKNQADADAQLLLERWTAKTVRTFEIAYYVANELGLTVCVSDQDRFHTALQLNFYETAAWRFSFEIASNRNAANIFVTFGEEETFILSIANDNVVACGAIRAKLAQQGYLVD